MHIFGSTGTLAEWSFTSKKVRKDPWIETSMTVHITEPNGREWKIPAFWAGGQEWRVRFPSVAGSYRFKTECADKSDAGLHGLDGVLEVAACELQKGNALSEHGPVRVSDKGRYFEHEDGTPFFWLGDTWWMLMSDRVSWPGGFRALTADRVKKGFTVVQIVVGFPPDTTPFDGRDGNEGGSPWEKGYERINPRYFDVVDLRLEWLVRSGIVPCIVGSWGYHCLFMGEERMREHWRYLVARYGAYPVIWCLAGETAMPYYLTKDRLGDETRQIQAWTRIARFVRDYDPFKHPLSTHPRSASWDDLEDPSILTFQMLQTGHITTPALEAGPRQCEKGASLFPKQPVVNAEPPYEGHMGINWTDVQRYAFWSTMLSGGAGFTYGAAGIFQANDRRRPTGYRPDGGAFDNVFWDESMHFAGSTQLGIAKSFLATFPFQRFEQHPEWVELNVKWGAELYRPSYRVYAAGIPGECRVIYIPGRFWHWDGPMVKAIEPGVAYKAWYVNTSTGEQTDLGAVKPDADGNWLAPVLPFLFDWVLALRKV